MNPPSLSIFVILCLLALVSSPTMGQDQPRNDLYTKLIQLIISSGLVQTVMMGTQDVTAFAPTNDAFDRMPDAIMVPLSQKYNVDVLRPLLMYHMFSGIYNSTELFRLANTTGESPVSLQGERVNMQFVNPGLLLNGNATVLQYDVPYSNGGRLGLAHVIDFVLKPPNFEFPYKTTANVLAELNAAGKFLKFTNYFSKFGTVFIDILNSFTEDGITLFLPTDSAMASFPKKYNANLEGTKNLKTKAALQEMLLFHFAKGHYNTNEFTDNQQLNTMTTQTTKKLKVSVKQNGMLIKVQGGTVFIAQSNIRTTNGMIHVISKYITL